MKTAIRYYTKTGNTKKLAESIANVVNVEAKTVDERKAYIINLLKKHPEGIYIYVTNLFIYSVS